MLKSKAIHQKSYQGRTIIKKFLLFLPALFLVGCGDYANTANYHFAENQNSCAFIFYDVEGAAPLVIEDKTVEYNFDENNIITTSSPPDFSLNKINRGFREHNYFIADGSKLEGEEEPHFFTGSKVVHDKERIYHLFNFNDTEECFSNDIDEDNEIIRELFERIYKN